MTKMARTERLLVLAKTLAGQALSLSVEELICFLTVAGRPGLSVGELAEAAALPQSTVSRHLKRLSGDLIAQKVHPLHGRQKALHLSKEGRALLARFDQVLKRGA